MVNFPWAGSIRALRRLLQSGVGDVKRAPGARVQFEIYGFSPQLVVGCLWFSYLSVTGPTRTSDVDVFA